LTATTNCELLVLDAACFRRIATETPGVHAAFCTYARKFREQLAGGVSQPLEVWYEFDRVQELAQDSFSQLETEPSSRTYLKSRSRTRGFLEGLWRQVS